MLFRLEFEGQHQGERTILWETLLAPSTVEADRGVQSWQADFEHLGPGRVYLQALAGPAANLTCDWGLWLKIELQ